MRIVLALAVAASLVGSVVYAQSLPSCVAPLDGVTSVGVTAVPCPASSLGSRKTIMLCNSNENAASPLVKIRIDGGTPVIGSGPGTTLAKGQCATFIVNAWVRPVCIADTAATLVSTLECK